jgi:hypothetical protein
VQTRRESRQDRKRMHLLTEYVYTSQAVSGLSGAVKFSYFVISAMPAMNFPAQIALQILLSRCNSLHLHHCPNPALAAQYKPPITATSNTVIFLRALQYTSFDLLTPAQNLEPRATFRAATGTERVITPVCETRRPGLTRWTASM